MPTAIAEPTLEELLQAFRDGAHVKDKYVDAREGAVYDHFGGLAAISWSRQARRDTDMFRAIYFATAEGAQLTKLLSDRYDFDRIPDSYGTGVATLTRPSAAAAGGTIWKGTRLVITSSSVDSTRVVAAADVAVGATDLRADVPIRASRPGPGTSIALVAADVVAMRVEDPLWDTSWVVGAVKCDEGTAFEPANDARARFRQTRSDARVGFIESMVAACRAAGADRALLFPSNYAGDDNDSGLNMAYVGDAGFYGSDALVRKVQIALEDFRVLGDNIQVRPLAPGTLAIDVAVTLWDTPSRLNTSELFTTLQGAILGYFDGDSSGFSFDRDAIAGAMMKSAPIVQSTAFNAPTSDIALTSIVGGRPNFPATLTHFRVRKDDISISFLPPS